MLVGMMPIPERPGPPLDLALTVFPLMLPGGFSSGLPFMNGSWSDGLPAANGSFIDKLYETAPNLMMALGLLNSNGTHRTCERCIEIPSTGQVPSPLEAMDVLMRITPNPSIASAEELYAMLWEQRSSLLGSQASRFGEVAYIFPPTPELGNVAAELPKFEVNVTLTLEVGSNINVPPVGDFIPPVGDFFPPVDDFFPPVGDFVPPGVSVPPIDDFVPPIDDFVPPVDDFVPPVDDFVPPVDDFVPPGASVPPIGDFVPPVGDFVPPVGDFVPPVGDFVPPAGDFVPPVGGFVPPVGDFVPPPVDDIAPPPVDDIAPPPVGDFVPPVGDFVPPVGDLVPPPVDDVLPPADDVVDGILGRRRSLRNAHADTLIPGLSMGISEIKDRINKTLAPALGAALDESTSNLGNPLQHIEITADFDFEPGEVYSVGVLMTIPSPFLIPEKLDAFMVALEAETQGGLPISSELTIKVSGIRGTFIPPRPPEFPPPGAVPPPPPLSPCDLCEACVARVYEEIVTIALDYRSSPYPSPDLPIPSGPNIPQELRPYVREKLCSGASNRSACQEVFSEIEASEVLRAAALCNYLGQCSPEDECQIASQRAGGVVAEMDFCTTDGTVKGELIGRKSIQPVGGDSCFSDDDCQDGETLQFCDKEGGNTTVQSYCNEQGFEVSKVQGVCTNRTTGAMPPPPVLSPCELCEDCVSRLYQEVVNNTLEFRSNISIESLPPDLMPPNIPQEARALVLERLCPVTTDGGACEKVYSEIKAPEVLRAAALCNHLGQCSPEDECQIVSPTAGGEAADMDFCTTDGTIFGELIGQKTIELDGGDSCFSDEDCIDGETFQLCDKAGNTTIKSFCNEQGFEVVEVQGVCANKTIGVPPPPVLSPCDLCEDCVSRVYQEVVTNTLEFRSRISIESLSPDLMPPNIPQEARALVLERLCPVTTDGEACEKVYSEIKAPEVLRAAALCNHLELCSPEDECQIASQSAGGEVADMDFCTTDGTVNGEMISQKSIELDGGDSCFLDEDCADGGSDRFCDKEGGNTTIKSYCNEQGFEVVKVQGECANKCRLPQGAGLIEQSQVTNCTSDQDCPEGESCQEAGPSCRVYSCNEETGEITTEPCGQICLPSAISTNLGLAYFEDSGDVIRVNLSTAAAEISLPCIVLFGGDANKELGSSAECRTTGQELVIGLSGDASIRPNETVSLREDQQALVAANSGTPFSGTSGAIQSCSNCAQPEAVVSGPTTLAPACEGTEFGAAVISGAQSSSPAGRSFDDVTWELVDHPSEYRPSSSDTMMRLLEEASQENRLVIRMGEDALESMPASDEPYTIRLSVTSFLGTSHSTNHSIVRQSSTGTPTVTLTTPSRAKITQGIVLDAEASRSSVCGKGEYKWSCEGHTPAGASSPENCTLLDNGYGRRLTRRISMDELQQEGVQPGDTLTFKLVARYEGQPATESETETEVEVLGADLEARLDGPSGTVQQSANEPLIFDASGSSDPLASGGANSSMEYSFSCFRLDVEGGFCFEPVSYQPSQDGPNDPTLSVNATKFAALDTAYLFTVTVSKDGRTATAGNVILLRGGEVTDVSVTRFCGGRQTICPSTHNPTELLSLAASFEASQGSALSEASYSWSFTDDQAAELGMQLDENNTASGTNSYAVLIKPEAIPRSGFVAVQCTVTLSAGASGTGIIRVPLHRPPVCTLPNGCLEILGGEDGRNKTLPSIDFPASATGFSSPDEDETLQYEFGFKDGDDFEASGSATSSNEHTFIATEGPGTYTPYVCAIDSRKARTCSESSFTLNSNSSISESDVQKLLDGIDFASLQDTGDDDAVFDGVSRLAAQLKGAQGSENEGSNIGNNEVVAALQSLNDTLNNEGSDTSTAVTAISRQYDLSDFATRSTDANDKSAETTVSALELIEKGQSENADPTSPSVAGKALSNLGNIGSSAGGRRRRSLQAVTEQTKTNLDRVGYAIKIIGRDLADQVSPGSTIVSDGGNIAMAAVRNSYQALSGANVEFSPSASNGARAGVFFQPDLADFCSQAADCNLQDRVTAVLAYVADSSVYTAVTNSWPSIQSTLNSKIQGEQGTDYGAINGIEAISGAMSIEVGGQNNGPLCDGSSCTMSVKIPVDVGMYNDSRELACARWSPPEGVSSSSDLPLDVNVTTTSGNLGVTEGTVTCDTTHLGTHFIVQVKPRHKLRTLGRGPNTNC
ncbi:hypothetical protein DUNSADRAFT_9309 [Dunaliella salina]|uniref:PKD/REJ-like domain-containing protein n=1 Tax=Dunaliella salina TaxID=3046 RepID=A0ABQ7GHS3_DUNSA|nr:hypothetical protein DUNSADRAFT_9309 [Dunaliella salina]|eukprot:KAF5834113.1 hypothetical protein DUNSADRAFT_9309 [Dunaliella salina]